MTDREALLAAVRADPEDDTPRLVYADWLQENGGSERAAFIRAQVEAARAEPFGPRARAAARRADELLEANRRAWTSHLPGGFVEAPRFERGFVGHLSVEPQEFVPRADALFAAEPVRSLRLYRFATAGEPAPLHAFFDLPRLGRLRRFELSPRLQLSEEEYIELAACPHLAGLRELSLRDNPVPPPWLADVLRFRFPELTGLELAENANLGPCLAETLPALKDRDLRRLDLTNVVFTSEQLKMVLKSRCLRRVEELRLGTTTVASTAGPLFHLHLSFALPWERLTVLDLKGHWVGNDGVREITANSEATGLRWLGLANNHLRRDAVDYLVESKYLNLNYLDVSGNRLEVNQIAALARRFPDAVIVS